MSSLPWNKKKKVYRDTPGIGHLGLSVFPGDTLIIEKLGMEIEIQHVQGKRVWILIHSPKEHLVKRVKKPQNNEDDL